MTAGWSGDEGSGAQSLTGSPEFLGGPPDDDEPQRPKWIGIGLLVIGIGIFALLFRSSPQPTAQPASSTTTQTTAPATTQTTVPEVEEETYPFRESVREAMIQNCELQRVDGLQYEAFFEYERCLLAIDDNLDETCYLVLKAQFARPDEEIVNAACEIDV